MKKIFTFLLAVLITAINASAGAVFSDGGKTLTLTDCSNRDFNNLNSTQLDGVKTLIIVGGISGNKFPGFVDKVKGRLEVLDMSGMDANEVAENYNEIKKMSSINTIKFPDDLETIPANLCEGFSSLTSVSLPASLKTIGANAFQACSNLQSITLPYGLETISGQAFDQSGLVSISIPGSVKTIKSDAFSVCSSLQRVVFEEAISPDQVNMIIESNAFQNANQVWDVYVETQGKIECKNEAFSLNVTIGQTQPDARLAILHFPANKAKDYVNQKHVLTTAIAKDPAKFQPWLSRHRTAAGQSQNGWHEFVHSAPAEDPDDPTTVKGEKFLKTWSEGGTAEEAWLLDGMLYTDEEKAALTSEQQNSAVQVSYYLARTVPDGVRAYIVNSISTENVTVTGGTEKRYTVTLKRIQAIPPMTGVILYGESNTVSVDGTPVLSMPQTPYIGEPLSREYWDYEDSDGHKQSETLKNFLIATGDEAKNVGPYDYKSGTTEVEYRNFILGRFAKTDTYRKNYEGNPNWEVTDDYLGFFRSKAGSLSARKAYLKLKNITEEFPEPKGYELVVAKDGNYNKEYNSSGVLMNDPKQKPGTTGSENVYWYGRNWTAKVVGSDGGGYDWGSRPTNKNLDDYLVSYRGEFEHEVDGIVTLTIPAEVVNNEYYTLQGVKVSNPTKSGIYIKNGKKVIIK